MTDDRYIETNRDTSGDSELREAAQRLLDAANEYWRVYKKTLGGNAVVWIKASDGQMVIMTRGEYAETLMRNIDGLRQRFSLNCGSNGELRESSIA